MPTEDECSHKGTDENADDEIPVVVHCQKHDDVSDSELCHVEESPDQLLEDSGSEGLLALEQWCRCLGGRRLVRTAGAFSRGGIVAW